MSAIVFGATTDVHVFRLCRRLCGERAAYVALALHMSNWFTFYTSARCRRPTVDDDGLL